jgi:glycosyltransferase involved in cell wall biosynthesis
MGFLRRIKFLFLAWRYDYIFIQREASPVGPPVFEWILSRLLRKKVIFDFDDAIWIPNVTASNKLAYYLKCFWKIRYICKWSYKVVAGNEFLAAFASRYNKNAVIIPTCVDTTYRYNRISEQHADPVVIGWTGSHSTLRYLDPVYPVLKKLEKEYRFQFLVICNQPPGFQLDSLRFITWNAKTEIEDLLKMNIGIMPLEEDAWSEGKCGFKLIQYLALGIPAVASPVGVNKVIIDPKNGLLCRTEEEWYAALQLLLENEGLRAGMGREGSIKIRQAYSVEANGASFLELFEPPRRTSGNSGLSR